MEREPSSGRARSAWPAGLERPVVSSVVWFVMRPTFHCAPDAGSRRIIVMENFFFRELFEAAAFTRSFLMFMTGGRCPVGVQGRSGKGGLISIGVAGNSRVFEFRGWFSSPDSSL